MLAIDAILYLIFIAVMLKRGSLFACCDKKINPLDKREIRNHNADTVTEDNEVQDLFARGEEHTVMVKDLQCFKWLMHRDIQGQAPNDAIMVVGQHGFGVFTVKGVSFSVKAKERFVLLGSSNSGTSSVITTLLGIYKPVTGKLIVNGLKSAKDELCYGNLTGTVGYQPQKNSVDTNLTVHQHLTLFAKIGGVPDDLIDQDVADMITHCELLGMHDMKAEVLSNGLLRRLTLGMALIGRPKLVILDNPVDGIDPINKQKMIKTILHYTENCALVVATRDVSVAEQLGQKIAVMSQGKFAAIGSVGEIVQNHGKGFNLEIKIDKPKLFEIAKAFVQQSHGNSGELQTIEEAGKALDDFQGFLDGAEYDFKSSFDFKKEFSPQGLLVTLHKGVEDSLPFAQDRLISFLLTQNLLMTIMLRVYEEFPNVKLSLNSLDFRDQSLTLQVLPLTTNFKVQNFIGQLDEITERLPVLYTALSTNHLDTVFSKLVSTDRQESERINQAILNKQYETKKNQLRRLSVRVNEVSPNGSFVDEDY